MDFSLKQVVVALESQGYQCQYLDGSLLANNGPHQLSFVEDASGNAVGTFPDNIRQALGSITEAQVNERFGKQMLTELGYGEFSPSSAKATGVGDVNAKSLGVGTGDQAVTDEQPQKGPTKPQNSTDLPGDFTGDSDNNDPAKVPTTGGSSKASTVGPHGASSTGSPGPYNQKPEKTQGIKVGHSLQQLDAPDSDKSSPYTGTSVGELGNAKGDGKEAGSAPKMGSSPAPLPSTQGAQALPKLPSPGKGKMTVDGATVEAILGEASPSEIAQQQTDQNAQMAQQQTGKKMYVVSREATDQPWTLSGTFESTTPETIEDAKESVMSFTKASPTGASMVVFSEMAAEEVQQAILDGQDPKELGTVELAQGQMEALNEFAGVAKAGKAVGKGIGSAAKFGAEVVRGAAQGVGDLAKTGAGVATGAAGSVAQAAGKGLRAAGRDLTGQGEEEEVLTTESLNARVLASLPESFGILSEAGPIISRTSFKPIDLAEFERKLTPAMAQMILEQEGEDEDPFAPPMPPGEGEEAADVPPPEGGEFGGEGVPPEDEAGMGGPDLEGAEGAPEGGMGGEPGGAPIDIGGDPAPQPIGGEQGEPGLEPGTPEPEVPVGEESRYAQAQQMCPDCDEKDLEQLVQVGIVGDLYKALVQQVMSQKATMQTPDETGMPLAASQDTTKASRYLLMKGACLKLGTKILSRLLITLSRASSKTHQRSLRPPLWFWESPKTTTRKVTQRRPEGCSRDFWRKYALSVIQ
jgi:hypothetical protein